MTEDAEVLFPGKTVVCNGEEITVEPYPYVICITKAAKFARPIVRAVALRASEDNLRLLFMELIADCGEDVLNLTKLAVQRPEDWWAKLPTDQGFELSFTVFEVNLDFFVQRLRPVMEKRLAVMLPQLPASSVPDTPSTPSSTTP